MGDSVSSGNNTAPTRTQFTLLLAAGIFIFYGAILLFWLDGNSTMHWFIENVWGVEAVRPAGHWYAPNPLPFFDLEGTLSWRDCHLRGLDVMAKNPCDPMGRPSNYSPLWYLLPTGGAANTILLGFVMDGLFLAALPWVLAPQNWREFRVSLLASLSYVTLYAIERANIDILMFLMMAGSVYLWRRRHAEAAFMTVMAAGALKFYPLALLAILTDQRPRRFLLFALAALIMTVAFGLVFWRELSRLPALMPYVFYFGTQFGAVILPLGIAKNLGLPGNAQLSMEIALIAAAVWTAWRLSSQFFGLPIDWTDARFSLLLGGASILCGSFLMMANVDYRAIFLLAVLPGLSGLTGMGVGLAAGGTWAAIFCLYSNMIQHGAVALQALVYGRDSGNPWQELPEVIYFLLRESLWWFLFTLLLALLLSWLRNAPVLAGLKLRWTNAND